MTVSAEAHPACLRPLRSYRPRVELRELLASSCALALIIVRGDWGGDMSHAEYKDHKRLHAADRANGGMW